MCAALALQRRADDDAGAAIGGVGGKFLRCPLARLQESRLQYQILRRIAGKEKLGVEYEIGALARSIRPRLAGLGEIAGDIADRWVELGYGDAQDVGLLGHACGFSAVELTRQWRSLGPPRHDLTWSIR